MKKLLLAGLVTLVLGGGNVYGMDAKKVSATRTFPDPQPDEVVQASISITTYKSNFLDEMIPQNFFDLENTKSLATKFGKCKKWNDAIEIVARDLETRLKTPVSGKRSSDAFYAILNDAQGEIDALLSIHYKNIQFYIDTPKNGRYGYPRQRQSTTTQTQTELRAKLRGIPTPKKSQTSVPDSKQSRPQAGSDDIHELIDGMGNLAIADADMKKVVKEDAKYFDNEEERARIQAIRIEIAEVRLMLRELLEQRESGTSEERERARVIIAGLELVKLDGKVDIKVAEIVEDKGFAGLVQLIVNSDETRRFMLEVVSHATDKDPLKKKARYIINGFTYFAKLLFKEDRNIRTIIKNNIDFIKVLAFLSFAGNQKDGCTRRPLNLFYASDPAYARNIDTAFGKMREILHPQGKPEKKACCQSWCCCGSKKPQAAVAGEARAKTTCCKGSCLTRCCSGSKPVDVPKEKCTCKTFSWAAAKTIACAACLTAAYMFSEHMLADQHGAGSFWPFS